MVLELQEVGLAFARSVYPLLAVGVTYCCLIGAWAVPKHNRCSIQVRFIGSGCAKGLVPRLFPTASGSAPESQTKPSAAVGKFYKPYKLGLVEIQTAE